MSNEVERLMALADEYGRACYRDGNSRTLRAQKDAVEARAALQSAVERLAAPAEPVAWLLTYPDGSDLIKRNAVGVAFDVEHRSAIAEPLVKARTAPVAQPADAQADALDAARHRYLRDHAAYVGVNPHARTCLWVLRGIFELPGKGFDAAVDAQIAAAKEAPRG